MELGPQIFFGETYAILQFRFKIFRSGHPGHPYFRPQKILKYVIFGLKSLFFGFCGATESPNRVPDPKIFLGALLDIFGAGRIFSGHPAPTTHNFGHRNFCIQPFLGENRHFSHFSPSNRALSAQNQKKIFSRKFSLGHWFFEKNPKNDLGRGVAPRRHTQNSKQKFEFLAIFTCGKLRVCRLGANTDFRPFFQKFSESSEKIKYFSYLNRFIWAKTLGDTLS